MAKTQTQRLMKIECAPECGFLVRDHDERELFELAISHCKNTHGKVVTAADLRPSFTVL